MYTVSNDCIEQKRWGLAWVLLELSVALRQSLQYLFISCQPFRITDLFLTSSRVSHAWFLLLDLIEHFMHYNIAAVKFAAVHY